MFLPSAQRRMSAVGRMEKQTAHPNPNLEPIEKPHVAYRVSRGTTPAYTPHERRTKWQRTLPDRTRTSIRVRPLLKLGSHQTTKQLRNRARPAGGEPRWPPKAVYRQRPAGGPDAKKAWGNRPLPNPGGRRRRCTDSGRPVGPTPRREIFMNGWKKRIFEVLGRIVGFVTANPDLFGKAREKTAPSMTVIQTRKTLTNIKTTKRSKGESQ